MDNLLKSIAYDTQFRRNKKQKHSLTSCEIEPVIKNLPQKVKSSDNFKDEFSEMFQEESVVILHKLSQEIGE